MRVYQHQRTTNDSNGKPRRLWIVWQTVSGGGPGRGRSTEIIAVYDEGYRGRPEALKNLYELPPVNVTPSDYRETIRWAKRQGVYDAD